MAAVTFERGDRVIAMDGAGLVWTGEVLRLFPDGKVWVRFDSGMEAAFEPERLITAAQAMHNFASARSPLSAGAALAARAVLAPDGKVA